MTVLIKGAYMSHNCTHCSFRYHFTCMISLENIMEDVLQQSRNSHCPLTEIPEPHGRLIDADKYIKDNSDIIDCEIDHPEYQDTLKELIDDAPTVIEAEEQEHE